MFGDAQTVEGSLQNFEVVQEVDFEVGLPLDAMEWEFLGEGCV